MASIKSRAFALVAIASALAPMAAGAQTLTTLHDFQDQARIPHAGVVRVGSHLVGTSYFGGPIDSGVVYRISLAGGPGETTLHGFTDVPDGNGPNSELLKIGGALYGTTSGGGADYGTVFKIGPDGSNYTVVHSFVPAEGQSPQRGVIHAAGSFYGVACAGGQSGFGTIYKMDPSGNVTVLYSFTGGADGACPYSGLTKVGHYLYGTTNYRGDPNNNGYGTIFRIKTNGSHFAVIHIFAGAPNDGASPTFSELVSFAGSLWGTTAWGGQSGLGSVYKIGPDGNNYSMVYSFAGAPNDAGYAIGPMVAVAADPGRPAALYGPTATGGAYDEGALFSIDGNGVETLAYSFANGADGGIPATSLINIPDSGGDRHLYGTTETGGQWGYGTVFEFTP